MKLDLTEQFYFDGFARVKVSHNSEYHEWRSLVTELDALDLDGEVFFEKSYKQTFDLIKADDRYTNTILNFVKNSNLLKTVSDLTCGTYVLGDFTLRKTYSKQSYMDWHRDTYFNFDGKLIGRVPPLIKIILYPTVNSKSVPCLKVIPGSHRRVFQNRFLDRCQSFFVSNDVFYSNDDEAIVFDSSIMHSASRSVLNNGAFRLIFNFCHSSQIGEFRNGAIVQELLGRSSKSR